jgi:hypothetical protein
MKSHESVEAAWLKPHLRLIDWFGIQPSQIELAPLKEAIVTGNREACPPIVIMEDGTVITGWITVCAYRELEIRKIPVTYWQGDADLMATSVVAAVVKDALTTRRLHDLMVAEAFQEFRKLSGESLAALAEHCGFDKTLRTLRRSLELLGLRPEIRKCINNGKITKGQARRIKALSAEGHRELAEALARGDDIRETLIDFGIINDEHGLSPHDSACRLLNLCERYLPLWRENPKGFRSAYVLGGKDKLQLIRETIHFLTYVRDELVNDERRASRSTAPQKNSKSRGQKDA